MNRPAFETYLLENNREDTGTIKSYLRGLDLLPEMIQRSPEGFEDFKDFWNNISDQRLGEFFTIRYSDSHGNDTNPFICG